MKRHSRMLGMSILVLMLIIVFAQLSVTFLQISGNYENRGDICIGAVCFSAFEMVLLVLLLFVMLAVAYYVYLNLRKKTVFMDQAMDTLAETYLRIVRINFVDGNCIFVKDNDRLADKLLADTDWNAFRERLGEKVHSEDLEMFKSFTALGNMRRIAQQHSDTDVCMYRRKQAGEYKWIRAFIIPMSGKYENCVLLCARDVEEAAKAEEFRKAQMLKSLRKAKEGEAEKADFLKFMAYDLHTPMAAVAKMSSLAKESLQAGNAEDAIYYMERVRSMGEYSITMLNDIMRRSIFLEEVVNVKNKPFFTEMLLASCTEYAAALKREGVVFELQTDEELQEQYMGDILRLTQVLYSLLSNAYKFNRVGGSVTLKVSVEAKSQDADKVLFRVEDTGCGISEEFMPDVFEAFARERQLTSGENKGVGYGLALAKSIADAMDAEIFVESKQDEGSAFTLSVWLGHVSGV